MLHQKLFSTAGAGLLPWSPSPAELQDGLRGGLGSLTSSWMGGTGAYAQQMAWGLEFTSLPGLV